MQVTINDTVFEVPFDLTQITLGQYLSYNSEYGKDLEKRLKEILDTKYDPKEYSTEDADLKRTLLMEEHLDIEALCWYSFWTKHDLQEVKDHPFITPLLEQYRMLRFLMKDDKEIMHEFPAQFTWKGEEWAISDFKVNPSNDMSFNEIITSKEVMRQVHATSGNRWDGLIYLCAVYCRKKGEAFSDHLIKEGSKRLEELKELPLNYALSVDFFLSGCANTSLMDLAYSTTKAPEIANQNFEPTMKSGDGLISSARFPKRKFSIFRVPVWIASNVRRKHRHIKS